jgi:hypothetical protein
MQDQASAGEPFSDGEFRDLQCLLGRMIPADAEYAVPGADDPLIFASFLESLGRDLPHVRAALQALAAGSGGAFAELPPAQQAQVATSFLAGADENAAILQRLVLLCYYRDDRVMRSINMEARPPFPGGFTLDAGDWSLLDPVRLRPKLWRDAG